VLEVEFLFDLEFDLAVHPEDYAAFTADLLAFAADRSLLPSKPPHPEGWPASNQNPRTQSQLSGPSLEPTAAAATASATAASGAAAAAAALATAAAAFCGIGSPRFKRTSLPTTRLKRPSPPPRGPAPTALCETGGGKR
jgi:hypothetical protein